MINPNSGTSVRKVDKREAGKAAGDCKWPRDKGWRHDGSRKERECLRHSRGGTDKTSRRLCVGDEGEMVPNISPIRSFRTS